MLISVLKQIFWHKPDLDERLAEQTFAPHYNETMLSARMRGKSESLQAGYLRYPALVHIETQALCNAACTFCPYPNLERKGARMSDELIDKILRDLADIPRELPFQLAPYKVSEPFVEKRLFSIMRNVNERLPNARISLISNGAALTESKIAELRTIRNIAYLNVSLNFSDPEEYRSVMKIPFERTVKRLDMLHEAKTAGELDILVRLTRVSGHPVSDRAFLEWTAKRYPAFPGLIVPRNDWIGDVPGAVLDSVPDAPCHRWFDLSITATGKVAMCCMDGEAKYGDGDVRDQHVLEIYNLPRLLSLRTQLISRRQADAPCNRCTYASF
jgi:hypothetical protein